MELPRCALFALLLVPAIAGHGPARAEEAPVVPGQISVVGHGDVEALPDFVDIDLRASKFGESVQTVKDSVDKVVSDILAGCSDLGIDPTLVTASQLTISPTSSYDSSTDSKRFRGTEVSRTITVHLTNLAAFNELISRAIQAGVNSIERIDLRSSKDRELRAQALLAAIRDGRAQAESIARETGRQLDRVTTVATDDAEAWYGFSPGITVTTAGAGAPEFRPGPIRISVRVFLSFSMR